MNPEIEERYEELLKEGKDPEKAYTQAYVEWLQGILPLEKKRLFVDLLNKEINTKAETLEKLLVTLEELEEEKRGYEEQLKEITDVDTKAAYEESKRIVEEAKENAEAERKLILGDLKQLRDKAAERLKDE